MSTLPLAAPPPTTENLQAVRILLKHGLLDTPSTLNLDEFTALTADHPNQPLVRSVIRAIAGGASSNIKGMPKGTKTFHPNHPSAKEAAEAFRADMATEIAAGRRVAIPSSALAELPYITANPVGAIWQKGKYRMIQNLSYPKGSAVNEHIQKSDFGGLVLDDTKSNSWVLREFTQAELEVVMGTEDMKAMYKQIPSAPCDQLYQAIEFEGIIYLEKTLVFGSSSSPFIACFFADILCWILEEKFEILVARHFVDNFSYFTLPHRALADQQRFILCFKMLNIELNLKDRQLGLNGIDVKNLGFIVNTRTHTISVPTLKRREISSQIAASLDANVISTHELEVINGKLIWLCAVVPIAFVYAKRIWGFLSIAKKNGIKHITARNRRFKHLFSSLSWFVDMLNTWCGISYNTETKWLLSNPDDLTGCAGDASHIGGAFVTPTHYSWWKWCTCCVVSCKGDMTPLELSVVLVGHATRIAPMNSGNMILWLSDNSASVSSFNKGYSSDSLTSDIVAELRFELIRAQVDNFRLVWVDRSCIKQVDLLTRGSLLDEQTFLSLPENSSRVFVAPYSTREVVILDSSQKPYIMGFSKNHPEQSGIQ